MTKNRDHLGTVAAISGDLETKGFAPVLVGGMALVVLGSQRVTKDFDFLASTQRQPAAELVKVMYRYRLELVTKFAPTGEVVRTIDRSAVAIARVKHDNPRSVFFYNGKTGLKVDVLLDFPLPAQDVRQRATRVKLGSGCIYVASPEDLIRLKEIARDDRNSLTDAQDLEFLKIVLGGRK